MADESPHTVSPPKGNLFIYPGLFYKLAGWENDVFVCWTNLIRTFVILRIVALIIYGPPRASSRARKLVDRDVHRQRDKRWEIGSWNGTPPRPSLHALFSNFHFLVSIFHFPLSAPQGGPRRRREF
jgi:hypothetical protein